MSAIRITLGAVFCAILALPATAGNYEFLAAPEITLNRVYRVDKSTGEVGACQYGLRDRGEKSVGETLCYPAGPGAGPQGPGEYGLVHSRHEKEGGVFRVNLREGTMSICYVLVDEDKRRESVVCTPPGK